MFAFLQGLVNKAQHIVFIESALESVFCPFTKPKTINEIIQVCGHSQCKCEFQKLEPEVVENLINICRKNRMFHAKNFVKTNYATKYSDTSAINDSNELIQNLIELIMKKK